MTGQAKSVAKVKKKKPNKRATRQGRPSKYNATYVAQAKECARNNLNDTQIAKILGVAPSRIVDWKIKYPDFAEAIREGRAEYDTGEVELSFRQQALPHDEVMQIHELRDRGRGKKRKMTLVGKRVKKNIVNVHAAEKVLKVEMPEKYGDRVKIGVDAQSLADVAAIMKSRDGK